MYAKEICKILSILVDHIAYLEQSPTEYLILDLYDHLKKSIRKTTGLYEFLIESVPSVDETIKGMKKIKSKTMENRKRNVFFAPKYVELLDQLYGHLENLAIEKSE
jgi:hypothetical protein